MWRRRERADARGRSGSFFADDGESRVVDTDNASLHRWAVERVARRLRARRCAVDVWGAHGGIDLVLRGRPTHTICVRVAHRRHKRQTVYAGGKTYTYDVQQYLWNLHVHAKRVAQPWCWVLLPADAPARALIIPRDGLSPTRKTVALMARPRRGTSGLRIYTGRWDILLDGAAAQGLSRGTGGLNAVRAR